MPCNLIFSLDSIENLNVFKNNPKLLYKLKLNTSEDSFYEAHQLYKTLHFRSISVHNYKEACDLIYNGIVFFFTKKSDNVYYCSDLSKVFIETLKKLENQSASLIDEELVERIRIIHLALASGSEERNEFSCTILKLSGTLFNASKNSKSSNEKGTEKNTDEQNLIIYQKSFGHVNIHRALALNYWEEENYVQSRYHFLHSTDGTSCAKMLIECHLNYAYPSEVDLFLTQNVLQFLCLRNLKTAREFYEYYTKNHPYTRMQDDKSQLQNHMPLCNFIKFLFICIQHDQVKWFNALNVVYKPSLDIDPSFHDYLERIGQYFFQIKPKNVEKGGNMLNNLFKMLTNPGEGTSNNNSGNSGSKVILENELEDDDLLD